MEFILNLLAFLFTDAEIQEIKDTTSTWTTIEDIYSQEEIAESNRLQDEELQSNLDFLDTLLK